jgi:hypothetical protein
MKKIILTAVMVWALIYVGLIDFSYAKDLSKSIPELTGAEMAEENVPIILVQRNIESNADDLDEKDKEDDRIKGPKDGVKWVEEVEVVSDDNEEDDDEADEKRKEEIKRRR